MVKLTGPLSQLKRGEKHEGIVIASWKGIIYARDKGEWHDRKSEKQLVVREIFSQAVLAWRKLPEKEKKKYRQRAKKFSMTGYHLFIREFMAAHVK